MQAGELLSIWLHRPSCEHDCWNAYGGTKVGTRTALCKADYDCPAGLAVNKALLRAQHRFAGENATLRSQSDRHKKQTVEADIARDESAGIRVNVYFAFLRTGARPRPILPPLTVQEASLLPSQSRNPRRCNQKLRNCGWRVRVQKDTVWETRHSARRECISCGHTADF